MSDSNLATAQSFLYDPTGRRGACITRPMVFLFAFFCAVIVANIYYAQPLIQLIAPDLGLSAKAASMIVSVTHLGFGAGVFFLVPLGDMVENRRLIVSAMCLVTIGLAAAASVHEAWQFLAACLVIGLASVSVQMIVPLAAHLTPEASRGRIVGNIMGGLTLGIL
jgi:predicted MFS family arabinose efflux permease